MAWNLFSFYSTSKQAKSISNYFTTQNYSKEEAEPNTSTSHTSECFDSPYKNALTKLKYKPPNDDPIDDFKTPQAVRSVKAFQPNVTANKQNKSRKLQKKSSKKKFSRKGNYILKITKDNFEQSDVNSDHLQLALALSKSTYAAEYPENFKNTDEDLPTILSPKKIGKVKTTLEKYGFKSDKPKLSPEHKRDILEAPRKNKYSKFRFLTPTLKTCTDEERESIIASKISLILCQNQNVQIKEPQNENDNVLFSDLLTKFHCKSGIIFTSNRLTLQEVENFSYYSKNLNVSPTKYQCGCLLKKWEDIPGREKSPDRSKFYSPAKTVNKDSNMVLDKFGDTSTETNTTAISPYKNNTYNYDLSTESASARNNCISPDLFNSDSELNCSLEAPENDVLSHSSSNLSSVKILSNPTSSESLKSHPKDYKLDSLEISKYDVFKSDTGIQHFESCCDDVENFSQKVYFLNKYSEINNKDGDFEELCSKPVKGNEKPVVLDLTISSSSDEDTSSSFKRKISDRTNLDKKNQSNNIGRTFIEEKNKNIVYDLTKNSSSNEGTSNNFKSKTNGTINLGNKNLTDISKFTEVKYAEAATSSEADTSFNTSPLQMQNSNDCRETTDVREETKYIDKSQKSIIETMETFDGMEHGSFDSTKLLNVTDYVNQILNEDNSLTKQENNEDSENFQLDNKMNLSRSSYSQESIVISDEELNYSSGNNKDTKNNKSFNDLSDDELDENCEGERDIEEINMYSGNTEDPKNCQPDSEINLSQGSCSQESIIISDEELNYSSVHSKDTKNNKSFYDLPDDEIDENCVGQGDVEKISDMYSVLKNKYGKQEISVPVHNRLTELKNRTSVTRQSLAKAFLEESSNEVFEDTNILRVIENETENNKSNSSELADVKTKNNRSRMENVQSNCENITPEKDIFHTANSVVTPENGMIIKTKDITPMLNYDEMDTPKVTKELQKFGLKPLKRQRGIKLLKYLYDSTHPLVPSNETEELSSDEDDQRVVKKKKKCNETTDSKKLDLVLKKQDVLGDFNAVEQNVQGSLIENENSDELIFERKYSAKISSCRVPLQIVWHNFVGNNPGIKEYILLYEPLQLEILHSMLKEQSGCKFHIQDLLMFLDKKCVTIRTGQAQSRRKAKT